MGERFVYVIGSEAGPNKIGISNDVVKRLAYIRSASGQPHRIMHQSAVPAGLAAKIERRAHWYLKDFHMTGEWFAAPADRAIDAIERASADRGEGPCCLRIGRQKQWTERLHLTMPAGARLEIDAALKDGEDRLAFIREAITRELRRREKAR